MSRLPKLVNEAKLGALRKTSMEISPTISNLIGSIYDCALDAGRWPDTLTELRAALGFCAATLSVHEIPSGDVRLCAASGITPEWQQRLSDTGPEIVDVWGGWKRLLGLELDEVHLLSRNSTNTDWQNAKQFAEWNMSQGFTDGLAVLAARDDRALVPIAFPQHEDAGPITRYQVDATRLLIPHLQRAVTIGRLLDLQNITVATFAATLDTLACAVILLAPSRRVVHANRAAESMLKTSDVLQMRDGVLRVSGSDADVALRLAIDHAIRDDAGIGCKGMNIPIQGRTVKHALHVLPLCQGSLRAHLSPSAVAAVFVAPATYQSAVQLEIIKVLFDLTAAEIAVVEQIVAGHDIAQSADTLGIGASTVKTHLQHIFDKTGVRRQVDLVALVSSFALPI